MAYVDGFIVPVPKKKIAAYKKMAVKVGKLWIKYGALEYKECMAEDVKPGKWTSFPQSVKLKKDEVVFFSYITYKNRKARDTINAKVMKDMEKMFKDMSMKDAPFDGKRMIFGGFKPAVNL
jgi:uncharacterized protein YbaA (DUF1428 family)